MTTIGTLTAAPGEKTFGFFKTGETHGRFPVHIPMHVLAGAQPGPTLVVQAGASGLEIEPALILPALVKSIDPAQLKGTLIVVPLMNTSGFEFEQVNTVWDDKALNRLGRGRADGSVSEQMIYHYFEQVLLKADALIDIRTGAQWGYHRYAGVYRSESQGQSVALAQALGITQVVVGQPDHESMAYAAAAAGKAVVVAYTGGGPGLRDLRDEDLGRVERALRGALAHLGMLGAAPAQAAVVLEAHTFLQPSGERGLVFMHANKRGQAVAAGEELGIVRHPFTGEVVERITAPRAGVMVDAGAAWPLPLEGHMLAILGDPAP